MNRTVNYKICEDEASRDNWYLSNRDRFVAELVIGLAKPGEHLLDAGCGPGFLAAALAQKGLRVSGIDADPESIERARISGRLPDAMTGDICSLPFPDKSFDIVVSSEVLEHVKDHVGALKELRRVCSGPIVLTLPAHQYLWTESDTLLLHKRRYSRKDVYDLAKRAGLPQPKLHPFCLIPGAGILIYKTIIALSVSKKKQNNTPLALRCSKIPKPLNLILKKIFRLE